MNEKETYHQSKPSDISNNVPPEWLQNLFESMSVGVVFQDGMGVITLANAAAERLLGLTLNELRGRTSADPRWRALREDGTELPADEHPSMITFRTGKPVQNCIMGIFDPLVRRTRWLSVSCILQLNDDHSPQYVYSMFEDVTVRRAAEAALESISDAVVFLDRDWRFAYLNAPAAKMLARSREELLGENIFKVFPLIVGTISDIEYHRAMETQIPVMFQQFYPPLSEWFEVRALPAANGLTLYFQIITERKKSEQALREAAERQNSMLRDVLASVTGGRLCLVEKDTDLPEPLEEVGGVIMLTLSSGLSELRQRIREAALKLDFSDERWQGLVIGASEAGMNAVVHGGGFGEALVSQDTSGRVQVRVRDWGVGINKENLPKAALARGWSSTTSLGYGLVMTIESTDRTYLRTGPDGTTIILEQDRIEKPLLYQQCF